MKQGAYIVDTDWVIHYLNGKQDIVEKLKSLRKDGVALSVISLAELYDGVYYSTRPSDDEKSLNDFLTGVTILGIDEETCKLFGKQRGKLKREGRIIDNFDLMIASSCLRWNLTLLNNNRKHFERLDDLKIISFS
jgi:tRNA(fMet)-specific endonuclease VapC